MKQVELVRQRVAKGLNGELIRLRVWISAVDGNEAAVEMLRGKAVEIILASLTESLLSHMGHSTALTTDTAGRESESKARRAVNKFTGRGG